MKIKGKDILGSFKKKLDSFPTKPKLSGVFGFNTSF